jgi:glycosyltransferase involved in cell wall biosynthesis
MIEESASLKKEDSFATSTGSVPIDVVVPTKNSARTLKPCLSAVYREIPVCHLIVIDANSSDGTVEILSRYPNVDLVRGPWHLGKAREIAIKRVHTDFFAFVDSDVVVGANWMKEMLAYMRDSGVGAVEGTGRPSGIWIPLSERIAQSMRLPKQRPYTGNTLIRTSVVKDIRLPDVLLYEDYLIRKHIQEKGLKWIQTRRPLAVQVSTIFESNPKQAIYAGQYAWQLEYQGWVLIVPFLLLLKIVGSFASAHLYSREKALQAAIHQTLVHVYYTCGLLKARFGKSSQMD